MVVLTSIRKTASSMAEDVASISLSTMLPSSSFSTSCPFGRKS